LEESVLGVPGSVFDLPILVECVIVHAFDFFKECNLVDVVL